MALGELVPGLGGRLGTVAGQLVVLVHGTFRRSIGYNFRAFDGGALVLGNLVQGGQEVLHGLALEFRSAHLGAVHQVLDLTLGGAGNHLLVIVGLGRHVAGLLDQHVGGVGTVGHLAGGEVDALGAGKDLAAQLQVAFLHPFHIVEVNLFHYPLPVLGHNPVVVADLLSLVLERLHRGLTALVHQNGSHFHHDIGIEIVLGIGDIDGGVDRTGHHFQDGRLALHFHTFGHFGHLFGRCAGYGKRCGSKEN